MTTKSKGGKDKAKGTRVDSYLLEERSEKQVKDQTTFIMTTLTTEETLEAIIDLRGFSATCKMIGEITELKAQHVGDNWPEETGAVNTLNDMADRLKALAERAAKFNL